MTRYQWEKLATVAMVMVGIVFIAFRLFCNASDTLMHHGVRFRLTGFMPWTVTEPTGEKGTVYIPVYDLDKRR